MILDNLDLRTQPNKEQDEQKKLTLFSRIITMRKVTWLMKCNKSHTGIKSALAKYKHTKLLNKSRWYLALAYLHTGQLNLAEALLNQIAINKEEQVYKQKARSLINAIKKE